MHGDIKGVSFPFRIGGRGGVVMSGRTSTVQQHIRECLTVLLGTMEYERVMRPFNGLEELDIFFEDLNATTRQMAIFKINEKVQEFEPRVIVTDIQIHAEVQRDNSTTHIVNLAYIETDTGNSSTLSLNL